MTCELVTCELVDASWRRSTIEFQTFEKSELDQAAAYNRAADSQNALVTDTINATINNYLGRAPSVLGSDAIAIFSQFMQLLTSGSVPLSGAATASGGR